MDEPVLVPFLNRACNLASRPRKCSVCHESVVERASLFSRYFQRYFALKDRIERETHRAECPLAEPLSDLKSCDAMEECAPHRQAAISIRLGIQSVRTNTYFRRLGRPLSELARHRVACMPAPNEVN